MTGPAPAHRGRRDNGLECERFSPVADVDPRLADHLLDVLGLREVPAYVEPNSVSGPTADRLYVDSARTTDAREVLTEIAAELGIEVSSQFARRPIPEAVDPLAGIDTDAEFAAIIAGLTAEPPPPAARQPPPPPAEQPRASGAAAADAVEEIEHFVPPPPPPLPRPAPASVMAVLVVLAGVAVLAFGGAVGLGGDLPLPLGVVLLLFGAGLLVLRLRPDPRDDSDDDGAVL